jgi:DNA-binding response OmpR family regulator
MIELPRDHRARASLLPNWRRGSKDGFVHGAADPPLVRHRILVAEDEALIALELQRILEDFGCEVVGPSSSVDEVLLNAERGGIDGALLGVNLRGRRFSRFCRSTTTLPVKFAACDFLNSRSFTSERVRFA